MKRYRLKTGIYLSLFIAGIASIPKVIRQDELDLITVLVGAFYSFVLLFAFWLIHNYFINSPVKSSFLKGFMSNLTSVTVAFFYHELLYYFIGDWMLKLLPFGAADKVGLILFRGVLLSGFMYFIIYYLYILFEKQKVQLELERLKKDNLEARLDSLKQQISPHFLFNSLSTLKTITKDDLSKKYIVQLANVYRYLLSHNTSNVVPLKEELEFTNSYLFILKERFESALFVTIQLDENTLKRNIPPLILQLLVENAIKHNIVSEAEPLRIEVFAENEKLVVRNNLQPRRSKEEKSGKGLQNISDRYEILSQEDLIILSENNYFKVVVPLL